MALSLCGFDDDFGVARTATTTTQQSSRHLHRGPFIYSYYLPPRSLAHISVKCVSRAFCFVCFQRGSRPPLSTLISTSGRSTTSTTTKWWTKSIKTAALDGSYSFLSIPGVFCADHFPRAVERRAVKIWWFGRWEPRAVCGIKILPSPSFLEPIVALLKKKQGKEEKTQ